MDTLKKCLNDWICNTCGISGHKAKDCESDRADAETGNVEDGDKGNSQSEGYQVADVMIKPRP